MTTPSNVNMPARHSLRHKTPQCRALRRHCKSPRTPARLDGAPPKQIALAMAPKNAARGKMPTWTASAPYVAALRPPPQQE
eukprot:10838344-Lingulodinium_polyedra.AAC.1